MPIEKAALSTIKGDMKADARGGRVCRRSMTKASCLVSLRARDWRMRRCAMAVRRARSGLIDFPYLGVRRHQAADHARQGRWPLQERVPHDRAVPPGRRWRSSSTGSPKISTGRTCAGTSWRRYRLLADRYLALDARGLAAAQAAGAIVEVKCDRRNNTRVRLSAAAAHRRRSVLPEAGLMSKRTMTQVRPRCRHSRPGVGDMTPEDIPARFRLR